MSVSRRTVLKSAALTALSMSQPVSTAFAAQTHTVTIKNFAFHPMELNIKRGDTVEWKNIDGFIHTATSDDGNRFDTEIIATGESVSRIFDQEDDAGEIAYHCKIYPTMKAQIIVEA